MSRKTAATGIYRAGWEGAENVFHTVSATDHLTFSTHKLDLANNRVAHNIRALFLAVMVPAYLTSQPGLMIQSLWDQLITEGPLTDFLPWLRSLHRPEAV